MNEEQFNQQTNKLFVEMQPTVIDWLERFEVNVVIGALLSAAYGIEPCPGCRSKKEALEWLDGTRAHSEAAYKINAEEIATNQEYK